MKTKGKLKRIIAGLACVGALVLSANAQAVVINAGGGSVTYNAGVIGDFSNPFVITVNNVAPNLFLDTINFDLGTNQLFNMTSTVSNIQFFGVPVFENNGDTQFVAPNTTHLNVPLPNLGLAEDYHLHPQGLNLGGGSYTLTMWGAPAAVPIPAAVYLFGSGLIGLVGLARRKMKATA